MQPVVVILAGGSGTRFAPFVTNKTMWPIGGLPLIRHTINSVIQGGFRSIIVITNLSNDAYVRGIATQFDGAQIDAHLQKESNGMDDALNQIKDVLGNRSIFVVNGTDVLDVTLFRRVFSEIQSSPHLLVCGRHTDLHLPVGYYVVKDEKVIMTVEKPNPTERPSNVMRLVADYFQDASEFIRLFAQFSDATNSDNVYEQAQTILLQQYGAKLIMYDGPWAKLKYPHYVLDVMNIYLDSVKDGTFQRGSNIHPTAVIEGPVYIDPTARIEAYAVIKGPTYIGKNAIIGNHTLVRQSMIEEGTTVGFGSEVARSYVGPDCNLHHTFIGDSVLEKKVNMSWGSVTANLRLDSKTIRLTLANDTYHDTLRKKFGACIASNAFLGVGVSTMPGTVIGPFTNIPPHTVAKGIVIDNKTS
ncbi:MAG: sugar phosphate nucleotidyltransferase [Candidatus Roizmanbacteria bacterium]